MTEWNFDLTDIPRGRIEERTNAKGKTYKVYVQTSVWAAGNDSKVYLTYWIPDDPKEPAAGRWSGWIKGDEPVAWMPFIKPVHPGLAEGEEA